MEPQTPTPMPVASPNPITPTGSGEISAGGSPDPESRDLRWLFMGPHGLRAGWTVAIFLVIMLGITSALDFLLMRAHLLDLKNQFAPRSAFFGELAGLLALLGAASLTALIERRRILDYNLRGPRRTAHFFTGMAIGFAALSGLVGLMAWGGWLHFGPVALSGPTIVKYAVIWGCTFLMVGCVEEGIMRCFLLATLTRGVNFWWAAGLVACMCGDLLLRGKGNGVWGVYALALAGVLPCLWLQMQRAPSVGFWNAAWLTSTLFGFGHTGNNGENWVGIFAAGAVGFVFCVSVWVTGSAWWAIGCHTAWDWAETYFYGTADSGLVARGHLLTTRTSGPALWTGGSDGPEGSVLVLVILVAMLIFLLLVYRRRWPALAAAPISEPSAG